MNKATKVSELRRTFAEKEGGWSRIHNCFFRDFRHPRKYFVVAVYGYLALSADEKTQECFPSQERMAKDLGMSDRTVRKVIKDLSDRHVIFIRRTGKWNKTRNHYTLLSPKEWVMWSSRSSFDKRNTIPPNNTPRKIHIKKPDFTAMSAGMNARLAVKMRLPANPNGP